MVLYLLFCSGMTRHIRTSLRIKNIQTQSTLTALIPRAQNYLRPGVLYPRDCGVTMQVSGNDLRTSLSPEDILEEHLLSNPICIYLCLTIQFNRSNGPEIDVY